MFDWLYFWHLIWSFFTLLSLVFVPVFIVMIYFATRAPRARAPKPHPAADALRPSRPVRSAGAHRAPGVAGRGQTKRAA